MSTLIITRGLPGSGKTTRARAWIAEDPEGRARINRDDLRHNMFGVYWGLTWAQEQTVTVAQHAAARALLGAGKDVVIDDTHLRLRNARAWADMAVELGAEFEVWECDADADECVRRDLARIELGQRGVGEMVIRELAQRYANRPEIKPSERSAETPPAAYFADPALPAAWLVDIDGTLAHMGDRSPYDITSVLDDEPDATVIGVAHALRTSGHLVIMSGRSEECRADTETWLDKHLGGYAELHMRAAGDNRKDFKVKADLFDAHVRDRWNVLGVLDDRDQVVKMWRSIGLKCLQVADGAF